MLFFFIVACATLVLWTASMGYIVFVGTKARFDRFCKENMSDPEMDWLDEFAEPCTVCAAWALRDDSDDASHVAWQARKDN